MATNTTNYNLVKPADNETVDIGVINANMDKVDAALLPENSLESESTKKALAAAQGKVLDEKITKVNESLTEVKQSDAKKLPLTGGTLTGGLQLRDALILTHNDNDNSKDYSKLIKAHYDAEYGTDIWEVSSDGRISFLRISGKAYGHSEMARALLVRQNADGSNYSAKCIYHEGNITVSQSAPSTALAEGAQHQVYA